MYWYEVEIKLVRDTIFRDSRHNQTGTTIYTSVRTPWLVGGATLSKTALMLAIVGSSTYRDENSPALRASECLIIYYPSSEQFLKSVFHQEHMARYN